jgi:hypothetical protein
VIVLPSAAKSLNALNTTPAPARISSASLVLKVTLMFLVSASILAVATVSSFTFMSAIAALKAAMKSAGSTSTGSSSTSKMNVKLP